MLVKVNQVGAIVSIDYINGVQDGCFGRRCSRCDDTFKRNRMHIMTSVVCTCIDVISLQ